MPERIGVIIIDDSAVMRQILARELGREADIEVLATAENPLVARDLILEKHPQVITLDLEMPHMNGLTFLRRVMKFSPMPVIVCSSLTTAGCAKAIECLEAGAFDVIGKPTGKLAATDFVGQLAELIRAARRSGQTASLAPLLAPPPPTLRTAPSRGVDTRRVIAIGSSTGGTEALRTILQSLPPQMPPILMTQHMPEGFTASFAERLNGLSALAVREAVDGDPLQPNTALLAPGGRHMRLVRDAAGRVVVRVSDGPPVKRHRPSVEVLFESVAQSAGSRAIGVILTGMGDDGAEGLLSMRKAGATTIAQDEASCVVFGMPKAAIDRGAAQHVVPLREIAERLRSLSCGATANAA